MSQYTLAVGLDEGTIHIFRLYLDTGLKGNDAIRWQHQWETSSSSQRHSAAVLRLAWCPAGESDSMLLASAGADHAVQVYRLAL